MKKFITATIIVILIYFVYQHFGGHQVSAPNLSQIQPNPNVSYKDGIYTGSIADAFYGNVEVQATISSGKIASVNFLQYPSDRSTSRSINSQAMPYLQQEAIAVQSGQVNVVSGATDTSNAFVQSLTSALAQAQS
jgi:uncharacterized protein with FMN-binding domain